MTRPLEPAPDFMAWNGRIDVDPDELEEGAPGFLGVSDEVQTVSTWASGSSDSRAVGISDPATGVAWSRAMRMWADDLGNLATNAGRVATILTASGRGYRHADAQAASPYGATS